MFFLFNSMAFSSIFNETIIPTEKECLDSISNSLSNYYIIAARGDITITYRMKLQVLESFRHERRDLSSGLYKVSEQWFIVTQLKGFHPVPARYTTAFGYPVHKVE